MPGRGTGLWPALRTEFISSPLCSLSGYSASSSTYFIFFPKGWREFPAQLCRAFPQRGLETLGPISWKPVTRVFFTLPSLQADLSPLGMGLHTAGAEKKEGGARGRERGKQRGNEFLEGESRRRGANREKRQVHTEENKKEKGLCCSSDLCLGALMSHCDDASRKSTTSISGPCPGHPAPWERHKCEMLPSPQRGLQLCGRVGLTITRSRFNLIQIKTLSSGSGKSADSSDYITQSGVSLGVCWASLCYDFPSIKWR